MQEYLSRIGKITLVFLAGGLIFDLVIAAGGANTFLLHRIPFLVDIAIGVAILTVVLTIISIIASLIEQQWKKASYLLIGIITATIVANISIKHLKDRSIKLAISYAQSLFTDRKQIQIQIDQNAKKDFDFFFSHYSPSSMKLYSSVPRNGRYDFIVRNEKIEPFFLTVWASANGVKYWVHR